MGTILTGPLTDLERLWRDGKCPFFEGILYRDGTAEKIERIHCDDSSKLVVHERGKCEIDFERLTTIYVVCERKVPDLGLSLYCGEGSWGGTGFVAVADVDERLLWIGIFDFSNPFVDIELKGSEVLAVNNLDEVWHFPIEYPSRISVDLGPFIDVPVRLEPFGSGVF